jgi:hypothetical protein
MNVNLTFTKICSVQIMGFNATCDPPMSFRDRHRFLNGIFNSYPDSDLITAKEIGDVARKVGLLREEVLSWFGDEKSRRMELLAKPQHRQQKLRQFPPSPETTRATSEISHSSSTYNAASPGAQSQSLDIFSLSPVVTDQKRVAPPTPKRGRPAKAHVETEPDLSLPDAKRRKISMQYPCPDCRNVVALERWAKPIDRKHFPENGWECPKTNPQTGKPCSSNHGPFYRHDNFATHLRGEHDCPDSEVVELKRTCKFEVTDFFHKICGFCEKRLEAPVMALQSILAPVVQTSGRIITTTTEIDDLGKIVRKPKAIIARTFNSITTTMSYRIVSHTSLYQVCTPRADRRDPTSVATNPKRKGVAHIRSVANCSKISKPTC